MVPKKQLPINSAARNSVWAYPRETPPRFPGALLGVEMTRSHEGPDVFSLPEGSDITVELYGGAVTLWLDGARRRVHLRRFDFASFPTEEEARHGFIRLWREVELLESPSEVELAVEWWLKARH